MCPHSHVQSHEGHKELPECPLPLALCTWTPQDLAVGLTGTDSALILHTEGQFLGIYNIPLSERPFRRTSADPQQPAAGLLDARVFPEELGGSRVVDSCLGASFA